MSALALRRFVLPALAVLALAYLAAMVVTGAQPVQRQLVKFEAKGVLLADGAILVALSDGKRFFDWIDIADTGHKWLADHTADREATYKLAGYATKRVPSLKAQAIPDFDAKKGKERLTSASQVKWSSGGLDDLET